MTTQIFIETATLLLADGSLEVEEADCDGGRVMDHNHTTKVDTRAFAAAIAIDPCQSVSREIC